MNELHNFLQLLPEYELRAIKRTIESKIAKDQMNAKLWAYYEAVENALILLKANN